MKNKSVLAILGVFTLLLAACGPAATPAPTATPMGLAPLTPGVAPTATPTGLAPLTPTPVVTPTPIKAPSSKYGGRFVITLRSDPSTWNMMTYSSYPLYQPASFMFNRLEHLNPGPPVCKAEPRAPGLAESWQWRDDKTLEVRLRKGVYFHNKPPVNGRAVTPGDVIASTWQATQYPGRTAVDVWEYVDRAEALGDNGVIYYLKQPYSLLMDRVRSPRVLIHPREMLEARKPWSFLHPQEFIGTGPFVFKEWRPGVEFTVEKNPNYWREGLPYVDGIDMKIMPEGATRVAAFRAGRVDALWDEAYLTVEPLVERMKGATFQECPNWTLDGIQFVMGIPPFNDVRLRYAVRMAIDFDALFKTVYAGKATKQYALLPFVLDPLYLQPGDYPPELRRVLEYNPAEARRLVVEAGYPQGLTTTYNYATVESKHGRAGEFLASELGKIGITLRIKAWDRLAQRTALEQTGKGVYTTEGIHADSFASVPTLEIWVRNQHTKMGTLHRVMDRVDPATDRLIEEAIAATDPKVQTAIVQKLQVRSVEQSWAIIIAAPTGSLIAQPRVKDIYWKGYYTGNYPDFLWPIWLEK